MLPTFIIGLREGVEAALIVGIIAAFLRQEARADALRWMWAGVALAIVICAAAGLGLHVLDQDLPERQQEGLEAVIALVAVGAVTFMAVWMRRHARGLKAELHRSAAGALARGSTLALVGMAFFAVLREGFETSVFLLAAFQSSASSAAAVGAVLGVAVAIAIGFAIYRGGVRLNLTRFFRLTGLVLVLVAAGLLVSALHSASEVGWITVLQGRALDLGWLVQPGTWPASLLTGMLGLRPEPTVVEALGYLLYAVPMVMYVLWPDRWRRMPRSQRARSAATA